MDPPKSGFENNFSMGWVAAGGLPTECTHKHRKVTNNIHKTSGPLCRHKRTGVMNTRHENERGKNEKQEHQQMILGCQKLCDQGIE